MNNIPIKLRVEIDSDPEYSRCMLSPYHECGGRPNTREHALIYANKQVQERFAIISVCAAGQNVDEFQDSGRMNKEMNVWVALNRATDEELTRISKVVPYFRERDRLNMKYGEYVAPPIPDAVLPAAPAPFKVARKKAEKVDEMEREARRYARANGCPVEEARELLLKLS